MRFRCRFLAVAMVAVLVLAMVAGCGRNVPEKVTLQLDWLPFGRFAPYYVALDKGYYKDAGLEVTIRPGNGTGPTYQALVANNAEFAFADIGYMVPTMSQQQVKLQAVAVIYAKAPHAIFFHKDSGIKTPKDLEGKTIATSAGNIVYLLFDAFAKANGVDASKVKWVNMDPQALVPALLTRKIDAMAQYVLSHPALQKDGAQIGYFMYGDYGIPILNNGLVVRQEYAEKNASVVKRFTQATMKGIKYALDNPTEAVDILRKHHPQVDKEVAVKELEILKVLVDSPETKKEGLGWIDPARMKTTVEMMAGIFNLKESFDVEQMYSNKYLK